MPPPAAASFLRRGARLQAATTFLDFLEFLDYLACHFVFRLSGFPPGEEDGGFRGAFCLRRSRFTERIR